MSGASRGSDQLEPERYLLTVVNRRDAAKSPGLVDMVEDLTVDPSRNLGADGDLQAIQVAVPHARLP